MKKIQNFKNLDQVLSHKSENFCFRLQGGRKYFFTMTKEIMDCRKKLLFAIFAKLNF